MKTQIEFSELPDKMPIKPVVTAAQKRKWSIALNDYCYEQSVTEGSLSGYCVCGYMSYCDLCEEVRSCTPAIKARAAEAGIEIDYSDYDFEKFLERLK